MARIAIPDGVIKSIIAEWRTGQYSQGMLRKRHGVSVGLVNKLCKGVPQDMLPVVNAGILYKQSLESNNEQVVNAVNDVVDKTVQRLEYLRHASIQNVQAAMVAECRDQNDFKARGTTIREAAETVSPKGATTAIQINNQAITEIERVIVTKP
jgi:hypothetical protein